MGSPTKIPTNSYKPAIETLEGVEAVRAAVAKERERVRRKKVPEPGTMVGREIRRRIDAPARLVNRIIRKAGEKGLERFQGIGRL